MKFSLYLGLSMIGPVQVILIYIFFLVVYLLPTIIAYSKNRKKKKAIMLVNIFLGWTAIGWFGSLVLSCMGDRNKVYINSAA